LQCFFLDKLKRIRLKWLIKSRFTMLSKCETADPLAQRLQYHTTFCLVIMITCGRSLKITFGPYYKNLRATSNKMMCETTDSHWNYYTSAKSNLLQISVSVMHVVEISLTLSFLFKTQYVSCIKSETVTRCFVYNSISIFRFGLLHGREYDPHIECIFVQNHSVWEANLCWLMYRISLQQSRRHVGILVGLAPQIET